MENEMNETVEETQEDNNAIKQMRERIKELEAVEKEYKTVQADNAIKEALECLMQEGCINTDCIIKVEKPKPCGIKIHEKETSRIISFINNLTSHIGLI